MTKETNKLRLVVVEKVRRLRQENKWTQDRLARLLGLSQNRLSEIERGRGSFTAEQLLLILKTFNAPLSYFASGPVAAEEKTLQNALARLGATHLRETRDILPSERLEEANRLIREVLIAQPSPRAITALAPVIVNNVLYLNIDWLLAKLSESGHAHRLAWLLENTFDALDFEGTHWKGALPPEWRKRYDEAEVLLRATLSRFTDGKGTPPTGQDDVLEKDILRSQETINSVLETRSPISAKWGIISRIQPKDFIEALRGARENY